MNTLISMTSFVINQKQSVSFNEKQWINSELISLQKIRNYAKFLQTPLQLGHFVPTDLEGNVLSDPIGELTEQNINEVNPKIIEFEEAKSRCLFYGFEAKRLGSFYLVTQDGESAWVSWNKSKTVESLLHLSPTLTETANKLINQ